MWPRYLTCGALPLRLPSTFRCPTTRTASSVSDCSTNAVDWKITNNNFARVIRHPVGDVLFEYTYELVQQQNLLAEFAARGEHFVVAFKRRSPMSQDYTSRCRSGKTRHPGFTPLMHQACWSPTEPCHAINSSFGVLSYQPVVWWPWMQAPVPIIGPTSCWARALDARIFPAAYFAPT